MQRITFSNAKDNLFWSICFINISNIAFLYLKNQPIKLAAPGVVSASNAESSTASTVSPMSKLQHGHAHNMLVKLVQESGSHSVAFTDEVSSLWY